MPEKETTIDHQTLFRLFLIVLLGYVLLWTVRYAGYYLFGYWGSLQFGDPMTMTLLFWAPVLLFFIIFITLLFALGMGGEEKAPNSSLLLYVGILLGITAYFVWLIPKFLIMGFS
jgi:hypothetical protein